VCACRDFVVLLQAGKEEKELFREKIKEKVKMRGKQK